VAKKCGTCDYWRELDGYRVCTYMDGLDLPPWVTWDDGDLADYTEENDGKNCLVWEERRRD